MADFDDQEKTEEATPRKREEAREKGQVALSHDIVSAVSLAAAAGVVYFAGAVLANDAGGLVRESAAGLSSLGNTDLAIEDWSAVIARSFRSMAAPALLVVLALVAVGALAGYAQVGFQVTPKAMEWDPSKLDPSKGAKRIFGVRGAARTLQSAVKLLFVGGAATWVAYASLPSLAALSGAPLGTAIAGAGGALARVGGAAIGTFALLAALDALYQRWQHSRDLMMSREEVRQELKSTEGDPQVRARIREIQRRMARQRMMADVPKATVVITNPTHVAVALRWDTDEDEGPASRRKASAPVVVAKGVDLVAQRIKEVAREHGVPLREDVPLARALHARCEVGDEIPAELYQAVAAVLAQVWNLAPAARKES